MSDTAAPRTFRFITTSDKFDPHKPPHRTRDGRPVRIIASDRKSTGSRFPIIALVLDGSGHEELLSYPITGKSNNPGADLLSVPLVLDADEALSFALDGYKSGLTWAPTWDHLPGGPYMPSKHTAQNLENHAQWMQGWADGIRAQEQPELDRFAALAAANPAAAALLEQLKEI